ncbi:hypothetical protein H6F67_13695 [Microcoleus sp. FACHB-1515]|uniref:hypothetical protein n=1 Tax=Cyanophyceae TaxID=3028117 RepID=UPI0016831A63|nr:hypothetical protein [Microcoleus sp. FACHB-1515]MBD2090905.1 hypothetical protein [Microcoleus sp. FACHB-1515]
MKTFVCLLSGLLLIPLPAIAQSQTLPQIVPSAPAPPPLLNVTPVNARISIRMINETGAAIDYEVIGDTQYRTLGGNQAITLQSLATPTTLTFRRQDGGLLQASLRSLTTGLELRLSATTDFGRDRTALTIDEQGGVFLN